VFGQHPFELSLQIADTVPQESELGLERFDAGLYKWALATDVFGPGGAEDIVILLDQPQRFLFEGHIFGEQTSDILRQEVLLEIGVLLVFGCVGSLHAGLIGSNIRR